MRKLVIGIALAASFSAFSASGKAQQRISPNSVESVARAIVRDYRAGGMSLLQIHGSNCYSTAKKMNAAGKCVLYDIAAHHLDVSFRQDQITDMGPENDYFSDESLDERVIAFVNSYLGGSKSLFESYFGHVPEKVDRRVANLLSGGR